MKTCFVASDFLHFHSTNFFLTGFFFFVAEITEFISSVSTSEIFDRFCIIIFALFFIYVVLHVMS
jgi:hypothetical protein